MNHVHYTHCPVCGSKDINPILTARDHSVSREDFVIWQCGHCSLRFTQNIPDEASIGVYYQSQEYISHSNTSKGLVNRLYQRVRKHTLESKAGLIRKYTKPQGRILDVGAGIGAFLNTMKEKGWEITGIEPDAGAREQSKALFGLELSETSVLPQLPKAHYDAITLWHVLEHVHDLHNYIETLKSLLAPGGTIFIAVPNYQSADAGIYGSYWAAYDVPRHLYHFTPKAIETLVQQHGLQLTEKKPMWFDSFYISLLSSKYRYGRTSWIGAGFSGLRSNITALMNKDRCSSVIYIVRSSEL